MNTQQARSTAHDVHDDDDAADDTLRGMFWSFYNRRMLWFVIMIWAWALVFMAVAIYAGIRFFKTDDTRYQILYAVIFLCSVQFIAVMKVFAWQLIHRNSIKRAIKRLEARIEQLCE
jgi:hypothetical protein